MSSSFAEALAELLDALHEAEETQDWEATDAPCERALALARTPGDLWRIVDLEPHAEAVYGEGEHPPSFLEAIFELARRWDGADRAATIALATRLTAADPGRIALIDHEEGGVRRGLAAVHGRHIDLFRAGTSSSDTDLQTASLHALALCGNFDESDLDRVRRFVDTADEEPMATAVLCLGAMKRLGKTGRAIAKLQTHASALMRACAASARVLACGRVDEETVGPLTEMILSPVALPPMWGWVSYGQHETSAGLALRIASWASIPDALRGDVVAALASLVDPDRRSRRLDQTLFRIAFGAANEQPELGYAREDLNTAQLAALAAFGLGTDSGTLHLEPLGLWLRDDVEPFLAGRGAMWQPLEIRVDGTVRHWHLARIWRECVWRSLDLSEAATVIVEGLDSIDLVGAVCRQDAKILLAKSPSENAQLDRHTTLMMHVLEHAAARQDLLPTALPRVSGDAGWMSQGHGLALLYGYAARDESPPAALDGVIGRALAFTLDHSGVAELLSSLGERGTAIVAAAHAYRSE